MLHVAPSAVSPRRRLAGRSATSGLLVAGLLLCGCGGEGKPEGLRGAGGGRAAAPPASVHVATVEDGTAPRVVRATGSFHPQEEVTVAAEVPGRIVQIGPEVGDKVAHGVTLSRVDDLAYTLARDQRARVLTESLAKLGLDALPEGDMDFEALPAVERTRLEAQNAKDRYERAQRLRERTPGAVSEEDFGDLKMEWDVAESALKGARLAVRTDLAQARTRRAELQVAERLLKDTSHRAPDTFAEWVVAERYVAVGDYVAAGSPVYRLVSVDPLRLKVRVPERRLAGVVKGRPVVVTTAGEPEALRGEVLRIRPEVDPRTRTYEVEVEVKNPSGRLSVGGFAVVDIDVGEDQGVAFVKEKAIVTFAGVTKVFVPDGAKAGERRVVPGRTVDGKVEIVEGLKVGDRYVVDPPADLVSGVPLKILDGAPASPAASAPAAAPPSDASPTGEPRAGAR